MGKKNDYQVDGKLIILWKHQDGSGFRTIPIAHPHSDSPWCRTFKNDIVGGILFAAGES